MKQIGSIDGLLASVTLNLEELGIPIPAEQTAASDDEMEFKTTMTKKETEALVISELNCDFTYFIH